MPNPFPIVGTWRIAGSGAPTPDNEVSAERGFIDPWPSRWTEIPELRAVRLDITFGVATLSLGDPAWRMPLDRRMMLGWQCRCNCERLVAYAATRVLNQFIRLDRPSPREHAFRLFAASSTASCGVHLRWFQSHNGKASTP